MLKTQNTLMWAGVVLISAAGIIHVIEMREAFEDAVYKGWLFCANGLGSMIAGYAIYLNKKVLGWTLGLVIAVGSIAGYIISRTIGLPLLYPEPNAWFEPIGVVSVVVEILFIIVYIKTMNKLG